MLLGQLDMGSVLRALDFDDQGVYNEVTEITSNHSQTHRRVIWIVRSQTAIIVTHKTQHLPLHSSETVRRPA